MIETATEMMNLSSAYIKASDLKGKPRTLTFKGWRTEKLKANDGKESEKGIFAFEGARKEWVVNKTNLICLKAMFGDRIRDWMGKKVTLFPTVWNGDDCIRVYGSPEIAEDMEVIVELPQRKPIRMTMHAVKDAA